MNAPLRSGGERGDIAVVLLGVGGVGRALLRLLASQAGACVRLVGIADSRRQLADAAGLSAKIAAARLAQDGTGRDDRALLDALDLGGAARRVIVDATASGAVASRHAAWLAAGYDVVTANKSAAAGSLRDWRALRRACVRGAIYGDAATVGAGLPVLAAVRRLRACGDAPVAIEGVFSGSLSWLFNRYDGRRPFSELLREACASSYTEPDPRDDLSGADVARKLVILARAAGRELEVGDVDIDDPVPSPLRSGDVATFLARADMLDAVIEQRRRQAAERGCVLRHVASFDAKGRAHVGLVAVGRDHPAACLADTDNLFALTTRRYRTRPLVIQGPGAGAEVTAQALLGDLLVLRAPAGAARAARCAA